MARTNASARGTDRRLDPDNRTAGGFGVQAAKQTPEGLLRRTVLANLLWEEQHYMKGADVASDIQMLVPQVEPEVVATIAVEARERQRLRHVPLYLAVQCARHPSHRKVVADLLPRVIRRADELTEFLSLYWDGKGKGRPSPLANSVKRGLAEAFRRFNAYELAKYDRETAIKLRDVMFLVHPQPEDQEQAGLWKALVDDKLPVPDTWEVALSRGADKRQTWIRLIGEGKLGALAFVRNLRNMDQAKVPVEVVREGFANLRPQMLLPRDFMSAAKVMPRWMPELEQAMLGCLQAFPKLRGESVIVVDVSGSMNSPVSDRSDFSRVDAAAALAMMAREQCEHCTVWATAGSDMTRVHATTELKPYRGFALADAVRAAPSTVGGGGIFTRQCLNYLREQVGDRHTARTIIFSDSQDCDRPGSGYPKPFSDRNYIVDVSAHTRGINYEGIWTAEVAGWSEHFLEYIAALEGEGLQ